MVSAVSSATIAPLKNPWSIFSVTIAGDPWHWLQVLTQSEFHWLVLADMRSQFGISRPPGPSVPSVIFCYSTLPAS